MTDIRTLLHEAAPTPAGPLDMAVVHARARRRSWRRVGAWVAGLGVVIGAAVPVGGSLLVSAGQGDRRPAAEDATGDDASSINGRATDERGAKPARDPGSGVDDGTPIDGEVGAPPSGSTADRTAGPSTTAAAPAPSTSHPAAASCSVDTAGLDDGAMRSCRFTATKTGGAGMTSSGATGPTPGVGPSGEVTVTRNGVSQTYSVGRHGARAGDAGVFVGCNVFIQPGDLVDVVLTNSSSSTATGVTTTLGAGEGWDSC